MPTLRINSRSPLNPGVCDIKGQFKKYFDIARSKFVSTKSLTVEKIKDSLNNTYHGGYIDAKK